MPFNNPFKPPVQPYDLVDPDKAILTADDVRAAYDRGRQDARAERTRHPVGMTFLFVAAGVGVGVAAYAAYEGSFARGGDRLDKDLAVAADRAEPMVRDAAHEAGQKIREAGQSMTAEKASPPTPAAPTR